MYLCLLGKNEKSDSFVLRWRWNQYNKETKNKDKTEDGFFYCSLTGPGRQSSCIEQDHWLLYGEAHMARNRGLWPRAQLLPTVHICAPLPSGHRPYLQSLRQDLWKHWSSVWPWEDRTIFLPCSIWFRFCFLKGRNGIITKRGKRHRPPGSVIRKKGGWQWKL